MHKRPAPLVFSAGASESQVSTTHGEGRLVCARKRVSSREVTCSSRSMREQTAERSPRHGWAALPAPRRIKLKTHVLEERLGEVRACWAGQRRTNVTS